MLAVFVNALTVILGSTLGVLLKNSCGMGLQGNYDIIFAKSAMDSILTQEQNSAHASKNKQSNKRITISLSFYF